MPAAARVGDKSRCLDDSHGCPACPHTVIGPIIIGSPNVMINSIPAARATDLDRGIHASCCGPNFYNIKEGSDKVFINGYPAARAGDQTQHCGGTGTIIEGSLNVKIGD